MGSKRLESLSSSSSHLAREPCASSDGRRLGTGVRSQVIRCNSRARTIADLQTVHSEIRGCNDAECIQRFLAEPDAVTRISMLVDRVARLRSCMRLEHEDVWGKGFRVATYVAPCMPDLRRGDLRRQGSKTVCPLPSTLHEIRKPIQGLTMCRKWDLMHHAYPPSSSPNQDFWRERDREESRGYPNENESTRYNLIF